MRRVGIGAVALLVVLGLIFGAVAGAVVGALTVTAGARTKTIIVHTRTVVAPNTKDISVNKYVPVTSAVGVVNRVGPAVVTIQHSVAPTVDQFGFTISPGGMALGSGFFIDNKGDIVTNNHVITGSSTFTVIYSDGQRATGTLVGADPIHDVAVVHVSGHVPAVARFGNSDSVSPGEPVVAIGNALGQFENTVTEGIVSGLQRNLGSISQNSIQQDMIQTDAAINHGNSGGPLLDMSGDVIGMNTAIDRSTGQGSSGLFGSSDPNTTVAEGLGFAIPSNTVAAIAGHLIQHVSSAFLGVLSSPVSIHDQALGIPIGDEIKRVDPNSPAEKAGLKVNDVIVAVDGVPITAKVTLEDLILPHKAGDRTELRVWRMLHYHTVRATLGTRPSTTQ